MHSFKKNIENIPIPKQFTYPFHYTPHPLALLAAEQLQDYLIHQKEFNHNFGLDATDERMAIGKMFGVLVVQNKFGAIGFLAAYSGKLADSNQHSYFVPPVYDMLTANSFFLNESVVLNTLNAELQELENDANYHTKKEVYETVKQECAAILEKVKCYTQTQKEIRDTLKIKYESLLSKEDFEPLAQYFINQSLKDKFDFKKEVQIQTAKEQQAELEFLEYENRINAIKELRKEKSAALQNLIFQQYIFMNANGQSKSLFDIFINGYGMQPPAAAGECAAPKLLHYAYINELKPIALAEFWWGASPKSEVRKHKSYYPACKSKCEPILHHMLQGLDVMPNPLLDQRVVEKLSVVFEDAHLLIIDKPAEFLSVPGIHLQDSVYTRMKQQFPTATGPLIVHRLDQATSGLLIIAKSKEVHALLQHDFIKRKVQKRYEALLDGIVEVKEGQINLPLRVDLDDRPRQMVCYEYGKSALTQYKVISETNNKTRVYFSPITGRTHQLRVHAAHQLGLNAPIVGDDLYGKPDSRLHLHAQQLIFQHPISKEWITIETATPF